MTIFWDRFIINNKLKEFEKQRLTAIISAANSGLYASIRMLWSLSNEGTIPAIFKKTNKNGIPVLALIFSMLGGVFALVSKVRSQLTQFA